MSKLAAIKEAPNVGDLYLIDTTANSGMPVILYCQEKSAYSQIKCSLIEATTRGIYLETENNFTNKNVSGRLMKFVQIKSGHLFFKLVDDK